MEISLDSSIAGEHLDRSSNVPLLHRLVTLKLRHLHRVVGCNIVPPPGHPPLQLPPCLPAHINKQPLQSGYFLSLHATCSPDCPSFLTTELVASSCPLWNMLHLLSTTTNSVQTSKGLVARVWYKPAIATSSVEQKTAGSCIPTAGGSVDTAVLGSELGHSLAISGSDCSGALCQGGPCGDGVKCATERGEFCSSGEDQKVCSPVSNCEAIKNQTSQSGLSYRVCGPEKCDSKLQSSQQNNFIIGNSCRSSSNTSSFQNSYKGSSRFSRSSAQAVNIGTLHQPAVSFEPPDPKSSLPKSNKEQLDNVTVSPPAVLVFSWAVRLSGLVPVGTSVSQAAPGLAPNTLLFQMSGSDLLYTAAECILPRSNCIPVAGVEGLNMRRLWYGIRLPMSHTKRSYSPALLTRLHQTERDVVIVERQCTERRDRLQYLSTCFVKGSRQRVLQDKVVSVQTRLSVSRIVAERERAKRDALRRRLDELEDLNQEKGMHVMALLQQLSRDRQQLRASCSHTEQQMQHLQRIRALLAHRRSCLVRDLAQVYPIVQISPKDDFSISNLWIPDAKFNNQSSLKTPTFQQTPPHRAKSVKASSNSLKNSATSPARPSQVTQSLILPDRSSTPSAHSSEASSQQSLGSSLNLKSSSASNFTTNEPSPIQYSQSLPPSSAHLPSGSLPSSSTSSLSSTPRSATDSVSGHSHVSSSSSFSPLSVRGNPSMATSAAARCPPIVPPFHPYPDCLSAPTSTSALPHSNESLSAGLGMAAHLLCLVSGLLQVPLRYPVSPAGSMATVTDVASTQLPQDNRKFPLYTRGKEREKLHFNYALFLLNKNIAQLHHYLGRPKPSSLPSLLQNLYTAVIHLSRPERPLTESLPDMRCQPLLTPFSDLWSEPLLPSAPPPTLGLFASPFASNSFAGGSAATDLRQCVTGRGNGTPNSSASSLLRSPQKCNASSRHYRSHSQSILVTSSSQSLLLSPRHSSFSKSPSPSHGSGADRLHKSVSVSARSEFCSGASISPLPPSGDGVPISSSLGDLVAGYGSDEHKERSSSSHGFLDDSRDGKAFDRSQRYVCGGNMEKRTARRSPLRSLNRSVGDSSQVSCSLDKGLDHIKDVVNNAKDIEIFVGKESGLISNEEFNNDTYVEKAVRPKPISKTTTGSLTNLTKDKSLIVVSDSIDFEDPSLARYEDHTTCLLRSWHEDNTASYTGDFATCGSTEQLEEVGVEATEGFMKNSEETGSVKFDRVAYNDFTYDDTADHPPHGSSPPNLTGDFVMIDAVALQEVTSSPIVGPAVPSLSNLDATCEKKETERSHLNRQKNSDKENKNNTSTSKSKSRSFWPFSRSNTSDESSRGSNNTSDKLSSLDGSSRLGSLENDDANSGHSRTPSETRHNSLPSNNAVGGNGFSKPPNDAVRVGVHQHQVLPSEASSSTTINKSATVGSTTAPTSQSDAPPSLSAEGERNRESALSDELLKQSLAALSKEMDGCCSADLSNLSDLTEVADRTAKLASKTFSFKMGTK